MIDTCWARGDVNGVNNVVDEGKGRPYWKNCVVGVEVDYFLLKGSQGSRNSWGRFAIHQIINDITY